MDIAIIEKLLVDTQKYKFPLLASNSKKEAIIINRRNDINQIVAPLLSREVFNYDLEQIWEKSKEKASKEFASLPNNLKLNSFYFQELMHTYVQDLASILTK